MRNLFKTMVLGLFAATPAFSGGWEASRIDTSMMYQSGSYAEVGTSSISYDIKAKELEAYLNKECEQHPSNNHSKIFCD